MSAMFVMIIASLAIALAFLGAFLWSVRKGHYDDDYTPSIRILFDDSNSDETKTKPTDIH
ncbi:cbb3-type cytochrome oxidase assembly protein CcoS [Dyadobacter psychrophilus]|uniref:Cytochrome oxidase maturation protein, cbb3-type n=1 Tax=Dyadobacter psychrophilus TaxID=651661 RepID=A0A1T5DBJ0_9BACT|nr:cbb3-type cytochrome oxidase assembly protein CcoS [Dyadobacter psychrophilus]SKB68893.1 cytochrome oxidase maturation protein, cbb3-type [Dyadobacter psychrophilus]